MNKKKRQANPRNYLNLVLLFAVALVPAIILISLIVAFGATGIGLTLGGFFYLPISAIILTQNVAVGLAMLGSGLIALGLGLAFCRLTIAITQGGFNLITHFTNKTAPREEKK